MNRSYDTCLYNPESANRWIHMRSFEAPKGYAEAICYSIYESCDSDYPVVMFLTEGEDRRTMHIYFKGREVRQ